MRGLHDIISYNSISCSPNQESFGIVSFCCSLSDGIFAFVKPLILNHTDICMLPEHVNVCHATPGPCIVVPIKSICGNVVYMSFSNTIYVTKFPNTVETD